MGGMGFHHDRISGHERRDGVAAGHRKRQRKIARAKNSHRPQWNQPAPQIWFRQRFAVRQGAIDRRFHPRAFAHDRREHFDLVYCSRAFTRQARLGQCRFRMGPLQKCVTQLKNFFGDIFEENGNFFFAGFCG